MGADRLRLPPAVLAPALLLAGCFASSPAPKAWQRSIEQTQRATYGAWTLVEAPAVRLAGELIAVEQRRLFLEHGDRVLVIPSTCVDSVQVAAFETAFGIATWGLLGTLSTPSHGYFLVFSLPIWTITTLAATYGHSSAGHLEMHLGDTGVFEVDNLRKWARFPQGLPDGFLDKAAEVVPIGPCDGRPASMAAPGSG